MPYDNLKAFFDKITSAGFLERLFFWRHILRLSYDAYEEFKSVDKESARLQDELSAAQNELERYKQDAKHKDEQYQKLEKEHEKIQEKTERYSKELQDKDKELGSLKESESKNKERILELNQQVEQLQNKRDELINENKNLSKKVTEYEKLDKKKQEEYEQKVAQLNTLREQLENDRKAIQQEREEEIERRHEEMKQTWRRHEQRVAETIKAICKRHNVEYVQEVPFSGKPDNTIRICGEYVIFDAKSPQGEDLSNFRTYIKQQAENAKKYAKQSDVKKDIFLVIPFNTVEQMDQFFYNMVDYNVHVVTPDAIEPVILALQKIENYEFAEQLAPEDREEICRIIGRFAHATKRRIQVDNFFANQFIGILSSCESLPDDIREKSVSFEKSGKLNPPMEHRAKKISEKKLQQDTRKMQEKAESEDIQTRIDGQKLNDMPLYKEESSEEE